MQSRSRLGSLIGLAFAVIGVIGVVFLGWRFGGPTDPLALAFGIAAVVAAVVVTVRRFRAGR